MAVRAHETAGLYLKSLCSHTIGDSPTTWCREGGRGPFTLSCPGFSPRRVSPPGPAEAERSLSAGSLVV